jgi:hypothetical protein
MLTLKEILKENLSREEFFDIVKKRKEEDYKLIQEKACYIARSLPKTREEILKVADNALEGRLILPGTGGKPFFVGNPPQWYENKVNYNEYVWQLNRMKHWEDLLQAYTITKQDKYAQKVIDELEDWIQHCPRPKLTKDLEEAKKHYLSVNMWRSLEIGIRMFSSWPLVLEHLIGSKLMTPRVFEMYAVSVYEHCEAIYEICPMLLPKADHNFYVMQNLGLLCAATLFPEFNKADLWKKHAIKELERCAEVQITEDGGHLEGCPLYHNGAIYQFCLAVMLAKDSGMSFSEEYKERTEKGIDYSIYAFRPSGEGVPWGDSKPNKEAITSAIYGYLAFNKIHWIESLRDIMNQEDLERSYNKLIWKIEDPEKVWIKIKDGLDDKVYMPTYNWQHKLNQVAMRTEWTREALSIFFGCNTPVVNGHSHIDPMNFDFTAYGKPLIVDPGRYSYAEDEDRYAFKSAAYHNTLTINNKDPFEYLSSWTFGTQKEGHIDKLISKHNLVYAQATHFNYEPAIHKRLIAIIDNSIILVLDKLLNMSSKDTVQIYYHFNSKSVELYEQSASTKDKDVNVVVYNSKNLSGKVIDGRISVIDDTYYDSKRLCLQGLDSDSKRSYVSVIVPYTELNNPFGDINLVIEEQYNEMMTSFNINGKQYSFAWSEDGHLESLL